MLHPLSGANSAWSPLSFLWLSNLRAGPAGCSFHSPPSPWLTACLPNLGWAAGLCAQCSRLIAPVLKFPLTLLFASRIVLSSSPNIPDSSLPPDYSRYFISRDTIPILCSPSLSPGYLSIFFLWISAQFKYHSSLKLFSCPSISLFLLWILNLRVLILFKGLLGVSFSTIHFSPLI